MSDTLTRLSDQWKGKIKNQNHINVNFSEPSYRSLRVTNYKRFRLVIDDHGSLYAVKLEINIDQAFSINKTDKIFLFDKPVLLPGLTYKVYISDRNSSLFSNQDQKRKLYLIDGFLQKLGITQNESVFCYTNSIIFGIHQERDLALVVDEIISFINENKDFLFQNQQQNRISLKMFPNQLRHLLPYCKRFSVEDDLERNELIKTLTERQRSNLVNKISPSLMEIDTYLASFQHRTLPYEAMLLGNLAELVSELQKR